MYEAKLQLRLTTLRRSLSTLHATSIYSTRYSVCIQCINTQHSHTPPKVNFMKHTLSENLWKSGSNRLFTTLPQTTESIIQETYVDLKKHMKIQRVKNYWCLVNKLVKPQETPVQGLSARATGIHTSGISLQCNCKFRVSKIYRNKLFAQPSP